MECRIYYKEIRAGEVSRRLYQKADSESHEMSSIWRKKCTRHLTKRELLIAEYNEQKAEKCYYLH